MGDGGRSDAAVLTPCSTVEDSSDGGEQDITPVEVQGALVEVGQAEEDCGEEERGVASDAALEQVLHPAAEEELFGDSDEEEGEDGGCDCSREAWPDWVEVEEAEGEAEGDGDGSVEGELAQADGDVAEAEAEIEAYVVEAANEEEGVDAGVEEEHLVEDGEVRGPGGLEPAEVYGEAERDKDEVIAPVAALVGVHQASLVEECGYCDGKKCVEGEPWPGEGSMGDGDEDVGDAEDCGD